MKIGVKTYNNEQFLRYFEKKADFFEIMAIENNDYSFLKKFHKEIVIHAQHRGFGINNSDKNNYKKNLDSINYAKKIADMTNSKKIIIHPGELMNENCSFDNSIEFIKENYDKRFLVENMPGNKKFKRLCETPEEIKEYMKKTGAGLCLDINHAILKAQLLKIDYIDFIKDLIKIKPKHYHIGGQDILKNIEHICFKESNYNLKKVINILPKDSNLTMETETDINKTNDDINILKGLIK
jgi:sugar phosphate isomerase/epimerase